MLKKILILSFLLLSVFSFADEKDDIINQLATQLEKSTNLIEEQNIVIKNNNKTITELKTQIINDQKEILDLREKLNNTSTSIVSDKKYYSIGVIIDYNTLQNTELNILFSIFLPVLPTEVLFNLGLNNKLTFNMGAGFKLNF